MKIADMLRLEIPEQWVLAAQMGIPYAVGRIDENKIEQTAGSLELLKHMRDAFAAAGLALKVIEPAPLNQKIKFGRPGRDEEIQRMITLIQNMGRLGIEVLCYNFMAHFGWLRTRLDIPDRGGALVTGYRHGDLDHGRLTEDGELTQEELWENLFYLQKAIVPAAEEAGVKLAIHPDDPPVPSIQGISRILISPDAMQKACDLVKSPNMGITLCQGTFQTMGADMAQTIRRFGAQGKIHFVHFRDTRGAAEHFCETFHDDGPTDMAQCILEYNRVHYDGYVRVDHVPTLVGENNKNPGYASLGRLFAVGYLKGLIEMSSKIETN